MRYKSSFCVLAAMLALLPVAFGPLTGFAAERYGSVEGLVTNGSTGEPVAGVSIIIQSGEASGAIRAITSSNGRYFIRYLEPGSYKLTARMLGYKSEQKEVEVTAQGIEKVFFSIGEKVFEAPEIVIESKTLTGGIENIFRLPGSAHYISKASLEEHNYNDINRILMEIPGINVQEEDGYGLRPNIGLRGATVERRKKLQ